MEFYLLDKFTKKDVENHLVKVLDLSSQQHPSNSKKKFTRAYKTIMLVGRTCEGKSTLTNHLIGKQVAIAKQSATSQTIGAEMFVSDRCRLNIIDTEGLDGSKQEIQNRELMEQICQRTIYYLEAEASIDAIIIMWCPLKNGRSGLEKTMKALQESFGKTVTNSCIFMIQGNWEPLREILDLGDAVPDEIKEMKKLFPNVPVIEYDAKGSVDAQLVLFNDTIKEVEPYQGKVFQERQKEQFLLMAQAFKLKLSQLKEHKEEAEKFSKTFLTDMSQALQDRETIVKEKKSAVKKITGPAKVGGVVAAGGVATSIAAVYVESCTLMAIGAIGTTAGVALVGASAILGTFYCLKKGFSWITKK